MNEYLVLRFFACWMASMMLAQSGSLTQYTNSNGLASPSTLGISSLPLLILIAFACLQLFFPLGVLDHFDWPIMIVLYLCLFPLFWWVFRRPMGKFPILLGLGLNLSVLGLYQLAHFMFMAENKPFPSELFFGSFKYTDELRFGFLLASFLIAQVWLKNLEIRLRPLLLGAEFAKGLGINPQKVSRETLLYTMFVSMVITFPFGLFSFIDLLIPHLVRLVFPGFRTLKQELFMGTFLLAIFVALLDMGCYFFPWRGAEFSLGLISSCFGPLILVYLIWKKIDEKNYAI
jgi:iron complex transport system permease protein